MSISDICKEIIKLCQLTYQSKKDNLIADKPDVLNIEKVLWHRIANNCIREGYHNIRSFVQAHFVFSMFNITPGDNPRELYFTVNGNKYALVFDGFKPLDNYPNISIRRLSDD